MMRHLGEFIFDSAAFFRRELEDQFVTPQWLVRVEDGLKDWDSSGDASFHLGVGSDRVFVQFSFQWARDFSRRHTVCSELTVRQNELEGSD